MNIQFKDGLQLWLFDHAHL